MASGVGRENYNMRIEIPILPLVILACLWQNTSMPRWIPIVLAALVGVALGLFYGWFVDPVQYTDLTPDALRFDYQSDYVLMVAEAYRMEQDPAAAARRLALLGSAPPSLIAERAYDYARQAGYPADDLTLMQGLTVALQTWQPIPGTSLP